MNRRFNDAARRSFEAFRQSRVAADPAAGYQAIKLFKDRESFPDLAGSAIRICISARAEPFARFRSDK